MPDIAAGFPKSAEWPEKRLSRQPGRAPDIAADFPFQRCRDTVKGEGTLVAQKGLWRVTIVSSAGMPNLVFI